MAIKRTQQKKKDQDTLLDLTQARQQATSFFEANQTKLLGVVAAVVVVVGGYLGYKNFIQGPREMKASDALWMAQEKFEQDSFQVALENPGGGHPGLINIISDYGGTKAGNLAKYYAGVAYLNVGQFDEAIKHLESYHPHGTMATALKHGSLGDAYSEKNEMDKALGHYEKAARTESNDFLAPYFMKKLALAYEAQGQTEKALTLYKEIKTAYPTSNEALSIDKYIARAEGK